MIFSEGNHIEQIKAGTKTQTRRTSDRYEIGKLYAVQPCRTCKGIPDGKILITAKRLEQRSDWPPGWRILPIEAKAEGGYSPKKYEELYEEMHPDWTERWAYLFEYYPTAVLTLIENGELDEAMALMRSTESQQLGTAQSKELRRSEK